mmetsp:Transcript_11943/g.32975  ORF Transcript_11943/g.32975 Transcript_11943/m.32975 type:complete len:88 (+) Transcript_11943:306-569(+)
MTKMVVRVDTKDVPRSALELAAQALERPVLISAQTDQDALPVEWNTAAASPKVVAKLWSLTKTVRGETGSFKTRRTATGVSGATSAS